MMCGHHQSNCFDWLKLMKCDSNNAMQKFNFTADSGIINMVNAPDKCVTFSDKWRIPGKIESCSEDTRFGVELSRGGDRTYKLQIERTDRAGGKSAANQIEVVQKVIDYSKKPIRMCAGVAWKRRTNSPKNFQKLMVRVCDENDNKQVWMDKFSYSAFKIFGQVSKFGHFWGFWSEIFGPKNRFFKIAQ